ncbi:MAG TPA: aldolase/citrate lyase family protein [Stellaceae bacterium]|nr:aldolase/citrate lyase family protein [Stellaceae bacterium]
MATVFALRDKWAKGETVFGIFASLPCAFACEVAALPGVDYICVDQQHGVCDYRDMVEMARGIDARGAVPLTRVPANEDWIIGKNLDAGAQGVIVPMVSTPREAAKAVAACRYPPKGERSNGPARAAIVMGTRDQKALGDGVLCLPMIETREGLDNVDAIAATPGLDGLYIGPSDLAISLGLGPGLDRDEPEHVAAVAKILAACQKHKIIPGIHTGSARFAKKFSAQGFRLVTFGGDAGFLRAGIERAVGELRG